MVHHLSPVGLDHAQSSALHADQLPTVVHDKGDNLRLEPVSALNTSDKGHRRPLNVPEWMSRARTNMESGVTSLYAMILVVVYVAFSFTELVTFPENQKYLEKNGFFLYLFSVANAFFVYLLWFTLKDSSALESRVVENHKAHGSLAIRFGAIIFGLGTLVYLSLELVSVLEYKSGSPCSHPILAANAILSLLMIVLQTYVIFVFPRLNLRICGLIDRLGTMHVVAMNIILWIRTLIRESLHEITESEEVVHMHDEELKNEELNEGGCNILLQRILEAERLKEECNEYHLNLLGEALIKSSPFLYPFVIECALIGASVMFTMWRHVGRLPRRPRSENIHVIRRPQPQEFLAKGDWGHSVKGLVAGLGVMVLAVVNLSLFFGLDGHNETEDEAEYFSKTVNTLLNFIGIVGLLFGIVQIQRLETKNDLREDEVESTALDLTLLRFTGFFAYLYQTFTIITGAFNHHKALFPNELHIVNGVIEAIQMTLQIIFIHDLKNKVLPNQDCHMPGRQVTMFLFLLNLSQWFVFSFEIQKVRASVVEAEFYGFMPWVLIQRVTLPLCVFFRFHSAVVSIELWKEVYNKKSTFT